MKEKILIDTDPGHDDAMAILLAIKAKLDIIAITTVAGNSTIENTTRNARYILELVEKTDIPVYSGLNTPLEKEQILANVHGESGLEGIDPTNEPELTNNAVEKIIEIVEENKGLTIVTLGPLTNIASAIRKKPDIISSIGKIIIMGGAIDVPGNKNAVAEFNMFVDPLAAKIVFNAQMKKVLVPLDACNHVQMQIEDFTKITGSLRNPILQMVKPYINNIEKFEGTKAALMYDPLTIYYLINENACETKILNVDVETKGDLTQGMTIADRRKKPEYENPITIVTYIDKDSFVNDFIEYLSTEN